MLDASVPFSRREAHARFPAGVWLTPDPGATGGSGPDARLRIRTREIVASTV